MEQADLEERLLLAADRLTFTDADYKADLGVVYGNKTGFVEMDPKAISQVLLALHTDKLIRPGMSSLDLGCGTGNWTILAAVAGLHSYGIDGAEELLDVGRSSFRMLAQDGIIPAGTKVQFVQGNMYPDEFLEDYYALARRQEPELRSITPVSIRGPGHAGLDIALRDVDVVYCWQWMSQQPLVVEMLTTCAPNALYVLPQLRDERMVRRCMADPSQSPYNFFIGHKA